MLDEKSLIHKKEQPLFIFSIVVSVLAVILLFVSIIGISIVFGLALVTLIGHAVSMAYIRLNGIQLSTRQFGELYNRVTALSKRFGIEEIPEVYILESGGALNAFASRIFGLFGKNIVVLYSDIVELVGAGCEDELDFVIAHELAHVKRNHVVKRLLTFLAMWIPFLGEAYSRACEYTADRMAVACTEKPEKAVRALTVFSAGKHLFRDVNKEEYLNQYNEKKGFFISLTELLSTHPAIPRRIFEIESQAGESTVVLKKKSKAGVIAIVISTILAGAFSIWTVYSLIDEVMNFTEEFSAPGELTPLMEAVINGDTDEVTRLLEEGADPNEQEPEVGATALIIAADNDQTEAARILLENGADPNLADPYGYTPLMSAVFMENKEMVELLLDAGADPHLENDEGMTAITYAEDFEYTELLEMMNQH
nr:M48 family metallopeptidase [Neobacillus sp. Marseille-Q6967]